MPDPKPASSASSGPGPTIQLSSTRRRSGIVIPHRAVWYQRLTARLIWILVHTIAATLRVRVTDRAGVIESAPASPVIFCTWHNRLAISLIVYWYLVRRFLPDRRLAGLVSASKDGGLLARVLELFEVEPVRGSTSRRGPQALLELIRCAQRGFDIAITPDGPRGPCYRVQEGVVALAQLTGRPIVPVGVNFSHKIRVRSWDRFQVPLPFARCEIVVGEPLHAARDLDAAGRESFRREVEERLLRLTRD